MNGIEHMGRLEHELDTDDRIYAKQLLREAISEEATVTKAANKGPKLDLTINVAMVFCVVSTLLAGAWWTSSLSSRVTLVEHQEDVQELAVKELTKGLVDSNTRTTKIEAKLDQILDITTRIDKAIKP
jgi:uncharacterized coiled-coil protein SlyX